MWKKSLLPCLLFCLLFLNTFLSIAQDQRLADSLALIYTENQLIGLDRLKLLKKLAFNETNNQDLRLKYCEELIQLSIAQKNDEYLYKGYYQLGNSYTYVGDSQKAIKAFFQSAAIAVKNGDLRLEGTAYMAIANVYSNLSNFENASLYYNKSIKILRIENDSILLASVLLNAGDAYFKNKKYSAALNNFEESGRIFKAINYSVGIAYNKGNIGMVYAEIGNDQLAESNINEAISTLEETKDYSPINWQEKKILMKPNLLFLKAINTTSLSFCNSLDADLNANPLFPITSSRVNSVISQKAGFTSSIFSFLSVIIMPSKEPSIRS